MRVTCLMARRDLSLGRKQPKRRPSPFIRLRVQWASTLEAMGGHRMDRESLRRLSVMSLMVACLLAMPLTLLGEAGATNSGIPPSEAVAPSRPEIIPPVTSKVLVYDDDWMHTPTGPERALAALGIPCTKVASPTDFVTQLGAQEWDLVIFANENALITVGTLDALQNYLTISPNHKAIVQTWKAGSFPSHPLWAALGIGSPVNFTAPQALHWWSPYHPLFNRPNEVPEFTTFNGTTASVFGAAFTLTGPAGPGLGGFADTPTAGQAGVVLRPDNRTIYKGLLDFCNDQDADGNGTWDVQEWWENAIRTLYPHAWRVLFVMSDQWGVSTDLNHIALYPDIQSVSTFDASSDTPTLAQLKAYDVVVVWSANPPYADPTLLGDRLADYIDAGGRVLCPSLNWDPPTYVIGGRFVSGGYTPLLGVGLNLFAYSTLGTFNPSHRLFWGASSANSYYRDRTSLAPGATLVASWADGWPFVATLGRVVAINAYVGGYSVNQTSGDITTLFHNAIAYLTSPRVLLARADVNGSGPALTALLNMGDIALVDEMDVHAVTPTLDQLRAYDLVLTWSNNPYADSVGMGDVLADYSDAGFPVILSTFNWFGSPFGMDGRIMGPSYNPLVKTGADSFSISTLGNYSPASPLMQGVSELSAYYRDTAGFNDPASTHIASWADGRAAVGTLGRVTAINSYLGGATPHPSGDVTTLVHNAMTSLFYLTAIASADTYAGSADLPVQLAGAVTGGAPPYTYAWEFGDGGTSTDQNPSHTYTGPGTFEVAFTATDELGRTDSARRFNIVVGPPLAIAPTAAPTFGVVPLPVAFAANATDGTPPYTYDWDYGDGTAHGATASPTHTYAGVGSYTPTLTVVDNQGHVASWPGVLITVNPVLGVTANAVPTSGSAPMPVSFSSTPTGGIPPYTYNWDFGDGTAHGTTQNPSHTYDAAGVYTATLTVTDSDSPAASASAPAITITVGAPLSAGASANPTSGSAPMPVAFTGTVSGGTPPYTYNWNYGDGTAHGTTQSPSHTYASAGTFSATLTVTDNQSHSVTTSPITISVGPPLSVSGSGYPTSGSAPMPVSFSSAPTGGTPPYSYDWNYGDGSAHGTTQNPSHTYASAGSFTASLTVSDSASHTASITPISLTVTAPLSGSASATPSSGSVPFTTTLAATASGGTPPYAYGWNFGDGSASGSGQSVGHTYNSIGTFTATVTVTDSAPSPHSVTATTTVTVKPPPPVIALMKKASPPFTIVVTGSNLQNGIQVYINGSLWGSVLWKNTGKIKLTGGASLKAVVPKGVPATFRFVNPDTGEVTTTWSW